MVSASPSRGWLPAGRTWLGWLRFNGIGVGGGRGGSDQDACRAAHPPEMAGHAPPRARGRPGRRRGDGRVRRRPSDVHRVRPVRRSLRTIRSAGHVLPTRAGDGRRRDARRVLHLPRGRGDEGRLRAAGGRRRWTGRLHRAHGVIAVRPGADVAGEPGPRAGSSVGGDRRRTHHRRRPAPRPGRLRRGRCQRAARQARSGSPSATNWT